MSKVETETLYWDRVPVFYIAEPGYYIEEEVAKYEAHLSRGLDKALHEFEALQVRRSGGAAPLARLNVDGLVES